jgi:hypothetical protein
MQRQPGGWGITGEEEEGRAEWDEIKKKLSLRAFSLRNCRHHGETVVIDKVLTKSKTNISR